MNDKIEKLLIEVVRALYSKPDLTPKVELFRKGRSLGIEVDVSPWNPGLLIGERGSMKFALELLIGYATGLDAEREIDLHVSSSDREPINRTEPGPADAERIIPIANAVANLLSGSVKVEAAETSVMAIFELPPGVAYDMKPPLSKVIGACGKAGGFNALPYVGGSPKA
jgi:predicted RNA-binding protein YlqC (UPF0109 family)